MWLFTSLWTTKTTAKRWSLLLTLFLHVPTNGFNYLKFNKTYIYIYSILFGANLIPHTATKDYDRNRKWIVCSATSRQLNLSRFIYLSIPRFYLGLKIGLFHFGEIEHNFGSCMGGIKNNKTYPYQPTHELVNDEFPLRNFLIIRVQFLVLLAVYQRFTHLSHTQWILFIC